MKCHIDIVASLACNVMISSYVISVMQNKFITVMGNKRGYKIDCLLIVRVI